MGCILLYKPQQELQIDQIHHRLHILANTTDPTSTSSPSHSLIHSKTNTVKALLSNTTKIQKVTLMILFIVCLYVLVFEVEKQNKIMNKVLESTRRLLTVAWKVQLVKIEGLIIPNGEPIITTGSPF
jgi:hypothetical protein